MKISRTEFKSVVKECLRELIAEGALNSTLGSLLGEAAVTDEQQIPLTNNVKNLASQMAKGNRAQQALLEEMLLDTAQNTVSRQQRAELPIGASVAGLYQPPATRNPLPPYENSNATPREGGGIAAASQASEWARLAFAKPLSNRPSIAGGAGGATLPGNKRGTFD